jgi:glycerol-3-phosphate dehydrogenase
MTAAELTYLLLAARQVFSRRPPERKDIIATWSGIRPIITSGKSSDPSKASREHKVWQEDGLVSCSGGKLTTFHHMALDVMSAAAKFLPPAAAPSKLQIFTQPSVSAAALLPGDPARGQRLLGRYGQDAVALLAQSTESERACLPGTQSNMAEVRWSLLNESVVHLDDLMLRRTPLGVLLENGGAEVLERVKPLCLELLGWDEKKWDHEAEHYRNEIAKHYSVPDA